jgi:drug/metabolite transporter (DMT)-like permease
VVNTGTVYSSFVRCLCIILYIFIVDRRHIGWPIKPMFLLLFLLQCFTTLWYGYSFFTLLYRAVPVRFPIYLISW